MTLVGTHFLSPHEFQKHLVVRAQQKQKHRRMIVVGLSLTSMVDMFSLLVIFLLQAFSTSPELLVMTKGVELPKAISSLDVKDAPVLALSNDDVYLDQKHVGATSKLLRNPAPLMKQLAELRHTWQKAHPKDAFRGEINLQAHRDLPSTIVSQFMGMLPSEHYGNIQLVVILRK